MERYPWSYPHSNFSFRAQLHLAAARLHSLHNKPGKTHCDVVMVTDLKGMLPKAIVNYVSPAFKQS